MTTESTIPLPACPAWCTLAAGHGYDVDDPDGTLTGWHEGQLATIHDDNGQHVTLTLAQQVTTSAEGGTYGAPFITITPQAGSAEFTSPHTLRDLGDAIRAAAARLEHPAG